MDGIQVSELEARIAAAIDEVLRSHGEGIRVSTLVTHLMAKAAVAVLEAVEGHCPPD